MTRPALRAVLAWCLLLADVRAQEPSHAAALDVLRDQIFQARSAISLLRTGDFQLRETLTRELDAVQREADVLRNGPPGGDGPAGAVPDAGRIRRLADRIDTVRRRARSGESVTGQGLGPTAVAAAGVRDLQPLDVPADTLAVVRLLQAVDVTEAGASGIVEAVTAEPVTAGDRTIAPAGALMLGVLAKDGARAALVFDRIQIGYTTWALNGMPSETPAPRLRAGAVIRLRLGPPVGPAAVR